MANEKLHNQLQEIALSDITDIGSVVPPGQYVCKLTQINPKPADVESGKAGSVEAVYEILDGDYEGLEIRVYYTLSVTKSAKNNKIYAPGISDMKTACAAVDRAFSPDFRMPLDAIKAGKAYMERMSPAKVPRVVVAVWEDEYKDPESGQLKKIFRKRIVGPPKAGQTSTASTVQSASKSNNAGASAPAAGSTQNILDALNLA